jgi:Co/Zn/Cd efflux system component
MIPETQAFRKKITAFVVFFSIFGVSYIIFNEPVFEEFMPRSMCMFKNQKLIFIHFLSDLFISVSYFLISIFLYKLYTLFRDTYLPFKGLLWMFAAFILFCGLTHAIGVVNLFKTYYWLDGIFKIVAAAASLGTAVTLIQGYRYFKVLKTPEAYQDLANQIKELRKENENLQRIINSKNEG